MVYPPLPWDWPQDWFKEFTKLRESSKTYVNIGDEFVKLERVWWTKILHRYLFWDSIEKSTMSMELLKWLCGDNTKSMWTLSLKTAPQAIYPTREIIYTFHFKNKDDLLLFKMKW